MSEAYSTATAFKAWADASGYSYAGKTDAEILQALVRASRYIDGRFVGRFPGYRTDGRDQVREWPRYDAYDRNGSLIGSAEIPREIIEATHEGARRELAASGSLSPDIKPGGGVVTRLKAGETEVEFANTGATQATITSIDNALASLLTGGRGIGALTRA